MEDAYAGQTTSQGLVLERRLTQSTEGVVLRLRWDRWRCREVVWTPSVAAGCAFVIVSFVKTLLGWLGRERQGGDIRGRRGAGHDIL